MIPPLALLLISAAVLAYEVLLVRLFAIVQWHHFAFMAISVALLGFGSSGALIVLIGERAQRACRRLFVFSATAFSVIAPLAFLLAQRVHFNALEVVWEPSQLLSLGLIYLLLVVPFTAGAGCIGLAFRESGVVPGRIYFWNLLGSGMGAVGILGALLILHPLDCLALVSLLGLMAALAAGRCQGPRTVSALALLGIAGAATWSLAPPGWIELRISDFKGLPRALAVQDATVIEELSGPLALLSAVDSPSVPFRHAPGLSIMAPELPPPQIGVFTDGAFATAIDRWDGQREAIGYLDHSTDALAYHLAAPKSALILEAAGVRQVLQAILHHGHRIDAVEENVDMLRLVQDVLEDAGSSIYRRPEVRTHVAAPRHFLDATSETWDLIQLPPLGTGQGTTVRGLQEEFLLTVEGLGAAYLRLNADGWLSATAEIELPPRLALRLVATLTEALVRAGVSDPADHLVAIRGMTTLTVAAKRGSVTDADIATLRAFADSRAFDLVHYSGMPASEANQRVRLPSPAYFEGMRALLGPDRDDFIDRYRFDISQATDNRPFFYDVFRWAALPELLALGPAAGAALLELGELIVTATLLQALVLGAILVLLPLRLRLSQRGLGAATWRFGLYFSALGLGFLFIEIAWIQRIVLFLGHPLYAVSGALTGFLIFAAVGAAVSVPLDRLCAGSRVTALDVAVAGLVVMALAYLFGLHTIFAALSDQSTPARIMVTVALTAPLAFFMGMPFPLGLDRVAQADADFVPWAWGLNGCASVVSAPAATLISMHLGISTTVLVAVALYLFAAWVLRPFAGRGHRARERIGS